jgi:hypothetical protein
MIKHIIIAILFMASATAHANDKQAGTCAGYLALMQKTEASVNMALASGDNHVRTLNHAKQWISKANRLGVSTSLAIEGDRACRDIGIRASDQR